MNASPRASAGAPSRALGAAALAGLVGLAVSACGASTPESNTPGGEITSSEVVPDLTLATFTAQCDERHGKVEVHPHCGGVNTCKGFSYDTSTQTLTEHTCKGLNTCGGYSCVIPG
ncbi:MAG: hypothetical protein OZ928_19305 [Polyangiaceae bacterium]|nr:hypothetical protein [Polyangiaceae bacterium]